MARTGRTRWLALAAGATLAVAGCEAGPGGTPAGSTAPPARWIMPNLVGSNLQQAQDRIQKLTGNNLFITTSHDATGQRRSQVLDANWKVCTQNLAAGAPIATDTTIDFGAVKLAESCP